MDSRRRYMCIAEYACICRPPGKSISKNTMIRHRSVANNRRERKGLSRLPWGPAFSIRRSTEVYNRFLTETLVDSDTIKTYESFQLKQVPNQSPIPSSSHNHVRNSSNTSSLSLTDFRPSQTYQPCQDAPTSQHQHVPCPENEIYETSSSMDRNEIMYSSLNDLTDISSTNSFNSDNIGHEHVSPVLQERAKDAFMQWACNNKKWIELLINFGISSILFQNMLKLLNAPYHCLTVKRNLIKYSKFEPITYISCRKHMLLYRDQNRLQGEDVRPPNFLPCDLCQKYNTTSEFTSFEYLPLRQRLIKWYSNEESFKIVTGYRRSKLQERTMNGTLFEDYFDGSLFKSILDRLGGEQETQYDLFLGVSTDGFQAFESRIYDCWPIVAINLNLDPSIRFLLKNLISLGYIKGPTEPERLDTFFTPLKEELNRINNEGGVKILCGDGVERRIRVPVLWITCDKAARVKLAGNCGQNGKCPCETCSIEGYWLVQSNQYYFPSKICNRSSESNQSNSWTSMFEIENLPKRTISDIEKIWDEIDPTSTHTTNAEKKRITVRTGIKPRTAVYSIPTLKPLVSFPHDTMHHIMNVSKDLLERLKGHNRHLKIVEGSANYPFILSTETWIEIDKELQTFAAGTSSETFGPIPRSTALWKCYKASECRDFFLNYAVILFTGRLPDPYLRVIYYYCRVVELCCRPVLMEEDINELKDFSFRFYEHFERYFYSYDVKRVGLMKSTIHVFLHLHEYVKLYGPFTNFNQYWVERKIGNLKHKLNSTNLAAESMNEQTKLQESYKLLFNEHFQTVATMMRASCRTRKSLQIGDRWITFSVGKKEFLNDHVHVSYGTKSLLKSFLTNKGCAISEAEEALASGFVVSYDFVDITSDLFVERIGAWKHSSNRLKRKGSNFYVSTEYTDPVNDSKATIYYGRIIKILEVTWNSTTHLLVLIDWATHIRKNEHSQMFCCGKASASFQYPTIEEFIIVKHLIAVVEHHSTGSRVTTFFIDPQLHSDRL